MGKLRPWCKRVKHEMIDRDINVKELAEDIGMARAYVSSVINGRVVSEPAIKKISSYLGVPDTDDDPDTSQDEQVVLDS